MLETGDVVIFSSRIIPGNEKAINRLQNALVRLGVEIVTEEDHFVHVSGHPARDELVRMYQMVRPQVAIPVHGEARHLIAHAHLAEECQVQQPLVIQNGDMVRLTPSGAAIVDEVPVGRLASDGKGLLPLGGAALKDRRRITLNGSAVATLVLDRQGPPRRTSRDQSDRVGRGGGSERGRALFARRCRARVRRAASRGCAATMMPCATRCGVPCAGSSTTASVRGR